MCFINKLNNSKKVYFIVIIFILIFNSFFFSKSHSANFKIYDIEIHEEFDLKLRLLFFQVTQDLVSPARRQCPLPRPPRAPPRPRAPEMNPLASTTPLPRPWGVPARARAAAPPAHSRTILQQYGCVRAGALPAWNVRSPSTLRAIAFIRAPLLVN